jgi:hypothetical protein
MLGTKWVRDASYRRKGKWWCMNITNTVLEAFYRQFKWLKAWLNEFRVVEDNFNTLRVEIVDLDLVRRKRFYHQGDPLANMLFNCSPSYYENLILLSEKGECFGRVGEIPRTGKIHWWQSDTICGNDDTVEALLSRIGANADGVAFVLSIFGGDVVIYKVPKKMTIQFKIESDIVREELKLKEEIRAAEIAANGD